MSFKNAWNNELNINIDEDTWQTAFKFIQDNNLIWFQYQILHPILGTQKLLSKIASEMPVTHSLGKYF